MRLTAALLLVLSGLTACAPTMPPTAYQPEGFNDGYGEDQIGGDTWHVYFRSTGMASFETAEIYWLNRCAELALAHGFDGFSIVKTRQAMGSRMEKRSVEGTIVLIKKPFVPVPSKTFDARGVQSALQAFIAGAKCADGNICPGNSADSMASGIFTRMTISNVGNHPVSATASDETYFINRWGASATMAYPQESDGWRLKISAENCDYLYDMPRDLNDAPWRPYRTHSVSIPLQLADDFSLHVVPPQRLLPLPVEKNGVLVVTLDRTLTTHDWRPPLVPTKVCR